MGTYVAKMHRHGYLGCVDAYSTSHVLKNEFSGPTKLLGQWEVVGHSINTSAATVYSASTLLRTFSWMDIWSCLAIDSYWEDSRRPSNIYASLKEPYPQIIVVATRQKTTSARIKSSRFPFLFIIDLTSGGLVHAGGYIVILQRDESTKQLFAAG
jgi:hypothetical protein